MSLKMNIPGVLRRRDVLHRCWLPRVSNVDDAEAFREHVSCKYKAFVKHQLDSIGTSALVRVAYQGHVFHEVGRRQVSATHNQYSVILFVYMSVHGRGDGVKQNFVCVAIWLARIS